MTRLLRLSLAVAGLAAFTAGPVAAQDIAVGNLVDFTGRTAVVGKEYGQAKIDIREEDAGAGGAGPEAAEESGEPEEDTQTSE